MWIVSMRFRTRLDDAQLESISRAGVPKFRALPELQQKYYVKNHDTGLVGGVYLFDSREAAQGYIDGPIVATVADRYEIEGDVAIELLEVQLTLDEE